MRMPLYVSFLIVASAGLWGSAQGEDDLYGRWQDNDPREDPIGFLVISEHRITVGHEVKYRVHRVGDFGDGGLLFAVDGVNRKVDPEACGPSKKVHYLAIERLRPIFPGEGSPGIVVTFDTSESPPTLESIGKDIWVCSGHPFSR